MNEEVVPATGRIEWILECGCEPMAEHCGQCDRRRQLVSAAKATEEESRMAGHLRSRGYTVTPQGWGRARAAADRRLRDQHPDEWRDYFNQERNRQQETDR